MFGAPGAYPARRVHSERVPAADNQAAPARWVTAATASASAQPAQAYKRSVQHRDLSSGKGSLKPPGWLLVVLAILLAGCGSTDNNQSTLTSGVVTTTESSAHSPTTEPTGAEIPQPPVAEAGLTIPLGGLPVGGAALFTADEPTQCVGVSLTNVAPIPDDVSIIVTQVHISSSPAGAFTLTNSSNCGNPCKAYSFTSTNTSCTVEVTWHPQGDSHGTVGLDGKAICGTADEKVCRAWTAEVSKDAGQAAQLDAYGDTVTTATTTSATTIPTSTATTSAAQPSTNTTTGG
jgi:hypothetical protein